VGRVDGNAGGGLQMQNERPSFFYRGINEEIGGWTKIKTHLKRAISETHNKRNTYFLVKILFNLRIK
jgi:hypothetical protein